MHNLNGGLMERKLKEGWVLADFSKYFGITDEEFEARLRKSFAENAVKAMMLRISRNQKRKEQKMRKVERKTYKMAEKVIVEEIVEKESSEEKLEALKNDKILLEEKIRCLESARKKLQNSKRANQQKLQKLEDVLINLRKSVEENMKKASEAMSSLEEIATSIESTNLEIKNLNQKLDLVISDIASLEKIQIFVYKNGSIEMGNEVVEVEEWNNIFNDLSSDLKFEDLTLKQIKLLAKLLVLTKGLERQFEIIFEDEVLEKIFKEF